MPGFSMTPNRPNGQFSAAKLAAIQKRQSILDKTGGKCAYCGSSLDFVTFHTDHVHASSNGGGNDTSNLLPACSPCNVRKGQRSVEDFRDWTKQRLVNQIQIVATSLEFTKLFVDSQITAEILAHLQEVERLLSSAKVTFYVDNADEIPIFKKV